MKPVDQENFGPGAGNCFSACIASLLEVGLYDVPGFSGAKWWDEWQAWLAIRGKRLEASWMDSGGRCHLGHLPCEGYFIATGPSPRGGRTPEGRPIYHSVIYFGRRMVHDPRPSRDGIDRIDEIEWLVGAERAGER